MILGDTKMHIRTRISAWVCLNIILIYIYIHTQYIHIISYHIISYIIYHISYIIYHISYIVSYHITWYKCVCIYSHTYAFCKHHEGLFLRGPFRNVLNPVPRVWPALEIVHPVPCRRHHEGLVIGGKDSCWKGLEVEVLVPNSVGNGLVMMATHWLSGNNWH